MPDKILHKRNLTTGNIPTTASLEPGELAINVADGKLFLRQSGSVANQIVTVGLSSSYAETASIAISSSFASHASTASYVNSLNQAVVITGSITMTGSATISGVDYIDFYTHNQIGTSAPAWKEGRVFYDTGSGALAVYNWEQDVTLNVGQEQWLRARNQTGTLITNGTVVRLVGAIGDRPTIEPAQSTDQTNTFSTGNEIIGMATHDIEHGTDGFITTFGLVNGLNTSNFAAGDLLWVSQSAGQFTNVPPTTPYDRTFVGVVARSNANNGTVLMTPLTPIHFHDISSVSASVYQMGDLWMYRSGSVGQANAWINTKALTGSYGIFGSLTATSFTGSLFGTATTASYVLQAVSSSFATSASYAPTPYGAFGIANSSGSYTYYTTFSASIVAATSGQTVEMFADVTETGSVTVTLKNGVNINGNGHTYTLNNSGLTHALTVPINVNTSCNILNLNVIRTGSTGSLFDNSALTLGSNGTGTINCAGSTFTNLVSGSGVLFNTNSAHEINYAVAYAKTSYGAFGMFTSAGAKLNNCIGYGTSGGIGIRCQNGGDIQNCTGVSDSSYGVYGLAGSHSNSVGISSTGNGFFSAGISNFCTGRSTSGTGFEAINSTNILNCTGISVSGAGFNSSFTTYNCIGMSSSGAGFRVQYIPHYNLVAKSTSNYAVWNTNGNAKLYNAVIVSEWNNAAGYGIRGNGGFIVDLISNCTFNLSNASAPYLFNDGVAQTISMRGNTYKGGAAFNANLTQAIVATQDNQGNIYL